MHLHSHTPKVKNKAQNVSLITVSGVEAKNRSVWPCASERPRPPAPLGQSPGWAHRLILRQARMYMIREELSLVLGPGRRFPLAHLITINDSGERFVLGHNQDIAW